MSTMYQDRPLGSAIVDAATQPFWEAAKQGVLKFRRCTACRKAIWYPRAVCPSCFGDTEWEASEGVGEIYSLTVTRRAGPIAFAMAYVRLDEGFTMLTNIADCDLDALRIGQRVKVVFKRDGERRDAADVCAGVRCGRAVSVHEHTARARTSRPAWFGIGFIDRRRRRRCCAV
jgi:uncharacterized OB-fold protein